MFDFNASLNDDAPASPILLPAYFMRMGKNGLLMMGIIYMPDFFMLTLEIELIEGRIFHQCKTQELRS